jgi:hypothetical protein
LEQPCMIGASLPSRDNAYKNCFSLSNRFFAGSSEGVKPIHLRG